LFIYKWEKKIHIFLNSTYLNDIFSVHIGCNKILYYINIYHQILKLNDLRFGFKIDLTKERSTSIDVIGAYFIMSEGVSSIYALGL